MLSKKEIPFIRFLFNSLIKYFGLVRDVLRFLVHVKCWWRLKCALFSFFEMTIIGHYKSPPGRCWFLSPRSVWACPTPPSPPRSDARTPWTRPGLSTRSLPTPAPKKGLSAAKKSRQLPVLPSFMVVHAPSTVHHAQHITQFNPYKWEQNILHS